MAYNDQLGVPNKNDIIDAKYTLNRFHRCEAAAAEPVTPVDIYSLQEFSQDAPAFDIEEETFQQGGGDDSYLEQKGYRYVCRFSLLQGEWASLVASLQGITHSTSGEAAIINRYSAYPMFHLERILRTKDNETHVCSDCYQDLSLRPVGGSGAMGASNLRDVECYSKHDSFTICSGAHLVYDVFTGDGSTTDFTLSSTALTVTDVTADAREDWEIDEAVFVKVKASGDSTGTRQVTGVTISGTSLTFTTAPADASTIQVLYVAATS